MRFPSVNAKNRWVKLLSVKAPSGAALPQGQAMALCLRLLSAPLQLAAVLRAQAVVTEASPWGQAVASSQEALWAGEIYFCFKRGLSFHFVLHRSAAGLII